MLHILVPTDFSDNAYAAMRTALQLARSYNAEVVFLHAMERPLVPATSPQEVYSSLFQAEQQELEQKLLQQCQQLYHEFDIRPKEVARNIQILPTPVADAILQVISSKNINILLMGSSGVSGIKKLLMGSNTSEMIRITTVPLLVVPPSYNFKGFRKISVVIRKKRFGNRPGLAMLERLAHTFSATVYFLFILDEDDQQSDALPLLEAEELAKGLNHEITTIRKTYKSEELERHIKKIETDLLVWLPMQGGFWGDALSESFTEEIATKACLPLLVVPHVQLK